MSQPLDEFLDELATIKKARALREVGDMQGAARVIAQQDERQAAAAAQKETKRLAEIGRQAELERGRLRHYELRALERNRRYGERSEEKTARLERENADLRAELAKHEKKGEA